MRLFGRRERISARLLAALMHSLLRRDWVRALLRRLLLLQVSLVLQCVLLVRSHVLLVGRSLIAHVGRDGLRHLRHGSVLFLGRVHGGFAIDAIGVGGLWSIEAGLGDVSAMECGPRCEGCHTWMRFLPSGLVTSGCSLGVVKV